MRRAAAPLLLLLAVAAVYRQTLGNEHLFFFGDIATQNYPWKVFFVESIRQGVFPAWFPYMHSGFPLYAEIQAGTFYPPNWIFFFLLPLPQAYNVLQALHLFLCGFFLFLYARETGLDRGPALFAAFAFIYSAFFFTHLVHLSMYLTACWLPVALLLLEKALKPGGRRWLLALTPVLALQILAGHPQIVSFSVAVLSLRLLWAVAAAPPGTRLRAALSWAALWGGTLALALGLSAVQILPTLELIRHSVRAGGISPVAGGEQSMAPWTFLLYIFPNLFGRAVPGTTGDFWLPGVNYWEIAPYVGLLPLFLLLVTLRRRPAGIWMFHTLVLLFSLLLMLGDYTPLYGLVQKVPPFSYFRAPSRFLLLATLSLALLSGRGLHILLHAGEDARERILKGLTRFTACATGALVLASAAATVALTRFRSPLERMLSDYGAGYIREHVHNQGLFLKPLEYYLGKLDWAVATVLDRLQAALDPARPGVLVPFLLMTAFLLLLVLYRKRIASGRIFLAACTGLLALDLSLFGLSYNPILPRREALAPSSTVERVLSQPGRFRVMRDVRSIPDGIHEAKALLPACIGAVWGVRNADQFTPLALDRYEDLLRVLARDGQYIVHGRLSHTNILSLLGTRYLPSQQPVHNLPLAASFVEEGIFLYELDDPLPLVFFVSDHVVAENRPDALRRVADPATDFRAVAILEEAPPAWAPAGTGGEALVRILEVSANEARVEIEVTNTGAGLLTLASSHYPGWDVEVDGERGNLYRVNYVYQGVFLEPGRHTVSFRFRPPGLKAGALTSIASLIFLAWLSFRTLRGRAAHTGPQAPPGGVPAGRRGPVQIF